MIRDNFVTHLTSINGDKRFPNELTLDVDPYKSVINFRDMNGDVVFSMSIEEASHFIVALADAIGLERIED